MITCDVCHKGFKKYTREIDLEMLDLKLQDVCSGCLRDIENLIRNHVQSLCLTCGKPGVHVHETGT